MRNWDLGNLPKLQQLSNGQAGLADHAGPPLSGCSFYTVRALLSTLWMSRADYLCTNFDWLTWARISSTFSLVTFIVLIMYSFRVYLASVPLLCTLRMATILFMATSLHPDRFLTHSTHFINSHSVIQQTPIELGCLLWIQKWPSHNSAFISPSLSSRARHKINYKQCDVAQRWLRFAHP